MTDLRRESKILPCHCQTVTYRPHEQGVGDCMGIPCVVWRWVSDWELADEEEGP